MNYSVELMEMATEHAVDHVVDKKPRTVRHQQSGEKYILIVLCFASLVEVLTKNGLERADAGDCMLVAPSFPEYHRTWPGEKKGFVNDWLYVNVKNIFQMEEIEPPLNLLIHTRNPLFLRPYLLDIENELMYRDIHYELIVSGIVERLLVKIARAYNSQDNIYIDSEYKSQMLELRQSMQQSIGEQWTVNRMSNAVGLSTSRFSVIYRKQFNNSPMRDVLEMRISEAKRLLISTKYTVSEIAVKCGLKNEYYFSRFFKAQVGITPSAYRKSQGR